MTGTAGVLPLSTTCICVTVHGGIRGLHCDISLFEMDALAGSEVEQMTAKMRRTLWAGNHQGGAFDRARLTRRETTGDCRCRCGEMQTVEREGSRASPPSTTLGCRGWVHCATVA